VPNHQSEEFLVERERTRIANRHSEKELFVESDENYEMKNIKWPTIKEFNNDLAIAKLEEYMKNVRIYFCENSFHSKTLLFEFEFEPIKTWQYDECWLFCIDPIEKIDKEFTTIYNYKACWSIPTRRRPIPRFTASVYFTFDVSKIKPKVNLVYFAFMFYLILFDFIF
jgi:A-kinase anchor protein 14